MEENREKSTANKVVVVTGGSRGIGAQIVKTLANENYKVILNYNNSKEQAEKIQQELLEQGKVLVFCLRTLQTKKISCLTNAEK